MHRTDKKIMYLQLLLVALLAITVNANVLSNEFVYDDNVYLVNDTRITSIKYIPEIFSRDITNALSKGAANYYRPLATIIFMASYHVFDGFKPWGFHLVNVLFHVGITLLIFSAASALQKAKTTSPGFFLSAPFVSALIFAVHPIHTQVVAWVSAMTELSFALFCLLSLYSHMRSSSRYDRWHNGSLLFFCLALFCKETTVALLPILVLYDWLYPSEKPALRHCVLRYAPYLLVIGMYMMLRYRALGGVAPLAMHSELSTLELTLNILPLFMQYLGKLLLPTNLKAFYVLHPVHSMSDPVWLCSLAVVAAFAALGYLLCKKDKPAFFGMMLLLIPLLPAFYIRGLGEDTFTERYLYFPSIGFALTAGSIGAIYADRFRKTISVIICMVLTAYSIGTIHYNEIWHDDFSLWSDTARKSPDSEIVQNNMGMALKKNGRSQEASDHFRQALAINPSYLNAHFNLGIIYESIEDYDAALKEFEAVLRLNPADDEARIHREYLLRKRHAPASGK